MSDTAEQSSSRGTTRWGPTASSSSSTRRSDPVAMGKMFERLGFMAVARHRRKKVTLYRQGEINFILNAEPDSFAQRFARLHGPSICAIAFRVADAGKAYARAISLGAWGYDSTGGPGELNIPAIKGIGDSMIYLVDRWRGKDGAQAGRDRQHQHLRRRFRGDSGSAAESAGPRPRLHRPPDAQRASRAHGRVGGLLRAPVQFPRDPLLRSRGTGHRIKSRAMTSPCGKIRIPINEEGQEKAGPDPGVPRSLSRRRRPAHRDGVDRSVQDGGLADCRRRQAARRRPERITKASTSGCPATASRSPSSSGATS